MRDTDIWFCQIRNNDKLQCAMRCAVYNSVPLQEGLFKFVLKHPDEAVDIFLKELHEPSMNRMFYNFLKQKNGGMFIFIKLLDTHCKHTRK